MCYNHYIHLYSIISLNFPSLSCVAVTTNENRDLLYTTGDVANFGTSGGVVRASARTRKSWTAHPIPLERAHLGEFISGFDLDQIDFYFIFFAHPSKKFRSGDVPNFGTWLTFPNKNREIQQTKIKSHFNCSSDENLHFL